MFVYSVVHQPPPGGGPEPLTTIVSPTYRSPEEVYADAARRLPMYPPMHVRQFPLEFPAVSSVPQLALAEVEHRYADCARCHLSESRTKIVYFRGDPDSSVALIGEGPGRDEDVVGQPFVGKSGRLENVLLQESGIPENGVGWINLVGCRPCESRHDEDRPPTLVERAACSERTLMLLRALRPRIVVCLGSEATAIFFDEPPKHNTWTDFPGPEGAPHDWVRVGVMRHPAYLLRCIAVPNSYKEYFGARMFLSQLRGMMSAGLTKVTAWPFGMRFLAQVQGPTMGGRP